MMMIYLKKVFVEIGKGHIKTAVAQLMDQAYLAQHAEQAKELTQIFFMKIQNILYLSNFTGKDFQKEVKKIAFSYYDIDHLMKQLHRTNLTEVLIRIFAKNNGQTLTETNQRILALAKNSPSSSLL